MWVKCRCPQREDVVLQYREDDGKFSISSSFENTQGYSDVKLVGYFNNADGLPRFDFGTFGENQNVLSLEKFYSLSYLSENSVKMQNLSHFAIESSGLCKYILYPPEISNDFEDTALTHAKNVLDSIKSHNGGCEDISELFLYIDNALNKYDMFKLPIKGDYLWYKVDDSAECFRLSSVNHLKQSEGFNHSAPWFFGKSSDERIYAVAVEGEKDGTNPLSNADDCTVSYVSSSSDMAYYVVGILLLDDGQYFCTAD